MNVTSAWSSGGCGSGDSRQACYNGVCAGDTCSCDAGWYSATCSASYCRSSPTNVFYEAIRAILCGAFALLTVFVAVKFATLAAHRRRQSTRAASVVVVGAYDCNRRRGTDVSLDRETAHSPARKRQTPPPDGACARTRVRCVWMDATLTALACCFVAGCLFTAYMLDPFSLAFLPANVSAMCALFAIVASELAYAVLVRIFVRVHAQYSIGTRRFLRPLDVTICIFVALCLLMLVLLAANAIAMESFVIACYVLVVGFALLLLVTLSLYAITTLTVLARTAQPPSAPLPHAPMSASPRRSVRPGTPPVSPLRAPASVRRATLPLPPLRAPTSPTRSARRATLSVPPLHVPASPTGSVRRGLSSLSPLRAVTSVDVTPAPPPPPLPAPTSPTGSVRLASPPSPLLPAAAGGGGDDQENVSWQSTPPGTPEELASPAENGKIENEPLPSSLAFGVRRNVPIRVTPPSPPSWSPRPLPLPPPSHARAPTTNTAQATAARLLRFVRVSQLFIVLMVATLTFAYALDPYGHSSSIALSCFLVERVIFNVALFLCASVLGGVRRTHGHNIVIVAPRASTHNYAFAPPPAL